ncbi:hypothetical protein ASPFODRAFT_697381 [Aspergillus luchuensis CBS 106.47]|uniref:Uncharacterized protein n=1 Tax=Aspergillus luchuensis (strain CBS 106.47) TaxID=1137211 RepID=A0A1M3U1E0_ASPLC|nr:hypothetical protein ASPFODRAFT_697381 [Aspergillus luchuensis CBS 106.47]
MPPVGPIHCPPPLYYVHSLVGVPLLPKPRFSVISDVPRLALWIIDAFIKI